MHTHTHTCAVHTYTLIVFYLLYMCALITIYIYIYIYIYIFCTYTHTYLHILYMLQTKYYIFELRCTVHFERCIMLHLWRFHMLTLTVHQGFPCDNDWQGCCTQGKPVGVLLHRWCRYDVDVCASSFIFLSVAKQYDGLWCTVSC